MSLFVFCGWVFTTPHSPLPTSHFLSFIISFFIIIK